jgi:hypothetical protein
MFWHGGMMMGCALVVVVLRFICEIAWRIHTGRSKIFLRSSANGQKHARSALQMDETRGSEKHY